MVTAQIELLPSASNNKLILAAQLAFLPTGVLTTLLGPMLPMLIARWSLTDTQAGNLFLVQFLASVAGVQLSGVLLRRAGYRPAFLLGLMLMSAGAATILLGSVWLGMAAVATYGLGLGLIIPTDSLLIAEISADTRTSAVTLLNFFWGIGAVFCSLMVALAAAHKMLPVFLGGVVLFPLVLVFVMRSLPFPPAAPASDNHPRWQELLRNPTVWLFGAVFFCYPGTETAVGGWIGSYVARLGSGEVKWAPFMPAFFWSALTAGRAMGAAFLSEHWERRILRAGFATSAAGIALMPSPLPARNNCRRFDYRHKLCHSVSHHGCAPLASIWGCRAEHRRAHVLSCIRRPGSHSVDGRRRFATHRQSARGIIAAAGNHCVPASDSSSRMVVARGSTFETSSTTRSVISHGPIGTISAVPASPAQSLHVVTQLHHGITPSVFENVPVGPSGPSSARRTASRAPSSTVSVPA